MGIHIIDVYSNSNIGIFIRANDGHILVPNSLPVSKISQLCDCLQVSSVPTSVAGSRMVGVLSVMNRNGILLSNLAEDEEIETICKATGLNVERFDSRYTAVGNLIAANDNGGVASSILSEKEVSMISRVLGVPVRRMMVASFPQVGAAVVATNSGALVHPDASLDEIKEIENILKVVVEPATVNRGVPFVSSGIASNTGNIVVGSLTSGPELMILSRTI